MKRQKGRFSADCRRKKKITFNQITRSEEVPSFANNYFMPALGKRKTLSLQANGAAPLEQVSECVHSWGQLIKWGRILTTSSSQGIASSSSSGSTLDLQQVHEDVVLFFFHSFQDSKSASTSFICCDWVLLMCMFSALVGAMLKGKLNVYSKSGHLTAGHFTADRRQQVCQLLT